MNRLTRKINKVTNLKLMTILAITLLFGVRVKSQVQLNISSSSPNINVYTDKPFSLKLNYQISSVNNSGLNVVATVPLPLLVEPIDKITFANAITVNNIHINNATYNANNNTVTVVFNSPIAAGTSGQFTLLLKYKAEITPNNYAPNLYATLHASNSTSSIPVTSNYTNVPAIASNNFIIKKTKIAGGALNNITIFQINISSSTLGALNLINPIVYDTLPAGTKFIEATTFNNAYQATYDSLTRIVKWTWKVDTLYANYNATAFIKVKYLTPTHNTVNTICDGVTLGGEVPVLPLNSTGYSQKTDLPCFKLNVPTPNLICTGGGNIITATASWLNKHVIAGTTCNIFKNAWQNAGNTELEKVEYILNIDKSINISYITLKPVIDAINDTAIATVKLEYATNTTSFTTRGIYNNKLLGNGQNISITVPSGQYITQIKITVNGNIPIGSKQILDYCGNTRTALQGANDSSTITEGTTYFENNPGDDGTLIYNSSNLNFDYNSINYNAASCSGSAEIIKSCATFNRPIKVIDNVGFNFNAGDTITYKFTLQLGGTKNAQNVIITDSLDNRLEFVSGTATFGTNGNNLNNSAITPIVNGNVYKWNLGDLNISSSYYYVFFKAIIKPGTPAIQIANRIYVESSNTIIPDGFNKTASALFNVQASSAIVAYKGQDGCLPGVVYFPNIANAVAGSPVNYHITIKNLGNTAAKDLVLVDVFPFINDFRGSQWFANLVSPIANFDTNTVIYYNTIQNPCITDITPAFMPTGCNMPVWNTTPPNDITAVKSIKIKRLNNFEALDSIYLTWQMRAPNGTPPNKLMSNTITYQAKRVDNSNLLLPNTPNMVSMNTNCVANAGSIGDFAWIDLNRNGIQDESANFGLNGVKVYLFNAGPNNQIGGGDDILMDSTITANHFNGNPGYYQFIKIASGRYYIQVKLQNNKYVIAAAYNQAMQIGNNSDIDPITGFSGLIDINANGSGLDKNNNSIDIGLSCNLPLPTISGNAVICFGSNTTLTTGGGNAYQWYKNNIALANEISNQITTNIEGKYTVTIKDSTGCISQVSDSIVVIYNTKINHSLIATDGNCNNNNVGNIALNVSGGIQPYTFLWNNDSTTQNLINLQAGFYKVTIKDSLNCVVKDSAQITVAPICNVTNGGEIGISQINCGAFTPNTIQSIILPSGGTGPVEYIWLYSYTNTPINAPNNGWTIIPNSNTPTFSPGLITQTTYFVRCARTIGLTYYLGVSNIICIDIKPVLTVTLTKTEASCLTNLGGSATALVTGGTPPYSYLWNGYLNTQTIQNLQSGNYNVWVADSNFCSASASISVNLSDLNIDFDIIKENCEGGFTIKNKSIGIVNFNWKIKNTQTNNIVGSSTDSNYFINLPLGNFEIKFIATNGNGCTDSLTKQLTVTPKPKAIITANVSACNKLVNFNNYSLYANKFIWNFGNPMSGNLNYSNDSNTNHIYTNIGNYTATLIAGDDAGCFDTITKEIVIENAQTPPTANFSYNIVTRNCATQVVFTNQSVNAINYNWLFSDKSSVNTTNATKSYLYAGDYIVKLVAISANGCVDTSVQTITILNNTNAIVASFFEPKPTQCLEDNNFNFTNNSSVVGNDLISDYLWDFGDNTYEFNSTNIYNKRYALAGTYLVKLIAISHGGCSDTAYQTVTVKPILIADFSLSTNCSKTVTIKNNATNSISNVWDFGDGNLITNNDSIFTYTYINAKYYTVKLHAVAINGCSYVKENIVYIPQGIIPEPNFNYQEVCGKNILFTNLSKNAETYAWNFGDNSAIDSTFEPSHAYANEANYNVTLTAYNGVSCYRSITKTIKANAGLNISLPRARFDYKINSCSNVIEIENKSVNANNYIWILNGKTYENGWDAGIKTNGEGIYSLTLIANNQDCSDTANKNIYMQNAAKADYTYSLNNCSRNVIFNNKSANGFSYIWNFGDTLASVNYNVAKNCSHTFTKNGIYQVTLIVSNLNSCIDTVHQIINVNANANASNVDFSFNNFDNLALCNNKVYFTNLTPGNNNYYFWEFGDGQTSTQEHPQKGFAKAGYHQVTLTVMDATGCKNSITKTIYIPENATGVSAGFYTTQAMQCITNNHFNFYNTSKYLGAGYITKYVWNFGDGNYDTTNTNIYSKKYVAAGKYTITLTTFGSNGCMDTATLLVTVEAKPCTNIIYANNKQGGGEDEVAENKTVLPIEEKDKLIFTLYPNPNNGNFTLNSNIKINGAIKLVIYDLFGRELLNTTKESNENSTFIINNLDVSDSQYFIVIYNSKGEYLDRKSFIGIK